jgi:hypothetical protein
MAAVERSLQRSIIGVDKALVTLRAMSDTLVDLGEITSNLPGRPPRPRPGSSTHA